MSDDAGKRKKGGVDRPPAPENPDIGFVAAEVFDIPGTDPELLRSGRIPDPQPEHTALFRWLAEALARIEEFLRAKGGLSLRWLIRFFWGALAAASVFLLVGPVINQPLTFDQVIASAKLSTVDWVALDVKADYEVTREPDGTFKTVVSERYNAFFVNQAEQRITRSLVTEVNGHDTGFELLSATIDGEDAYTRVNRKATTTDVIIQRQDGAAFEEKGKYDVVITYVLRNLVDAQPHPVTGDPTDLWSWPLFGLSWPQATKGIEATITLPRALNDALLVKPFVQISWLLVSGNERMEPEVETPERVRYQFDNDQTLPPNAQVWVEFTFEPGTFVIPERTPLFWLQSWGPLIPLFALAVLVLFALAARWVVWADSAGRPWYLMRADPPADLSPNLAAQLLGQSRRAELVAALADAPSAVKTSAKNSATAKRHERWLRAVAQAGRRAGRLGNLPAAWSWRVRWSAGNEAVEQKLRWKPDSYVRDTFIWAPIAVTLMQWALLRQLSHQTKLLVVWWPTLFVLVSTVLAIVALWAVWRPRPLTPKGALAVQDLKGIDAYARATRLVDRGPIDDPLLPYAVLFAPSRETGDRITEHAIREVGDRGIAAGWRNAHFLSVPVMLSFVAALAMLAGSIVLVATRPAPYDVDEDFQTWPSSDVKGTIWTQTHGLSIEAELVRDSQGGARLEAVERFDVEFVGGRYQIPQFAREWPSQRLGQSLGLEVQSVRVDDAEVRFMTRTNGHTTMMATMLTESLDGMHEVEVRYTLDSPAIAVQDGGDTMQQVRWAALIRWWDDDYYTNFEKLGEGKAMVRPLRVQLTVAPELAGQLRSGGWIGYGDTDAPRIPFESGRGYDPWVYLNDWYLDKQRMELRIGSETVRSDGALVVAIDADEVETRKRDSNFRSAEDPAEFAVDPAINDTLGKHELRLTTDVGAVLDFKPGTFSNVDDTGHRDYEASYWLPFWLAIGLALLVILLSVVAALLALRGRGSPGLSVLLFSWGTIPLLALAQTVEFWWVTGPMDGSSKLIPVLITTGLAMWAVVIVQWIVVGRSSSGRAVKPSGSARNSSG